MVYNNLFPCIDFEADFIIKYTGTIPVKVNVAEIFPIDGDIYPGSDPETNFLEWLWAYHLIPGNEDYGAWVEAYKCEPIMDDNEINGWNIDMDDPVDVGYQLHDGDYVYVKLVIHLPQDNNLQELSGTFSGKVSVIQWNDTAPD